MAPASSPKANSLPVKPMPRRGEREPTALMSSISETLMAAQAMRPTVSLLMRSVVLPTETLRSGRAMSMVCQRAALSK